LGADIRSTAAGKTVETIIENRRITGDPTFTADPNGAWANLAGIGYYFPDGAPWQSLDETRSGSWHDINAGGPAAVLTAQYRTLWFDHGVMPAGASYSYMALPGKSADDTAAYAASPAVQIIENDAVVQAVTHTGLGITAANFWSTGSNTAAGITCDSVGSVIVHQAAGQIDIAVADATQAGGVMHVEIATPGSSVIASDDGVSVDQISPTIRLSISVKSAAGKSFRVSVAQ
jgi:hyaluronate lyase